MQWDRPPARIDGTLVSWAELRTLLVIKGFNMKRVIMIDLGRHERRAHVIEPDGIST